MKKSSQAANALSALLIALAMAICGCSKKEETTTAGPADAASAAGPPNVGVVESKPAWNMWFVHDGAEVSEFGTGERYEAWLDVSLLQYAKSLNVPASPELLAEISSTKGSTLHLKVRAVSLTDSIELDSASRRDLDLVISLDKLFRPTGRPATPAPAPAPDASIAASAASMMFGGGSLSIPFFTKGNGGCAQLALSIWDATGKRPLDHLVATLPIHGSGPPDRDCPTADLQGGFGALLNAASAQGDAEVDAALHIFEYFAPSGDVKTVAILVDAHKYKPGLAVEREANGIYIWAPENPPSRFLAGDMVAYIAKARTAGYSAISNALAEKLFNDPSHPKAASDALLALKTVSYAGSGPTIIVRAVRPDGAFVYLPLSILGAKGGALTSHPLTIYPLPRESHPRACVDAWDVAIPKSMDGIGEIELPADQLGGNVTRIPDIDALSAFLGTSSQEKSPAPSRSEGLLLLAHQAGGNLYFEGDGVTDPHISIEANRRVFRNGSVAVLSACSALNPQEGNQDVVNKLNANHVDTIIASPFPVETEYASALAKAFLSEISAARAMKKTPTMRELFERSTQAAASGPGGKSSRIRRWSF